MHLSIEGIRKEYLVSEKWFKGLDLCAESSFPYKTLLSKPASPNHPPPTPLALLPAKSKNLMERRGITCILPLMGIKGEKIFNMSRLIDPCFGSIIER